MFFICLYYICLYMEYLIMYCFIGSLFINLCNFVWLFSVEGLLRIEVVCCSMCLGCLGFVGLEFIVFYYVWCMVVLFWFVCLVLYVWFRVGFY